MNQAIHNNSQESDHIQHLRGPRKCFPFSWCQNKIFKKKEGHCIILLGHLLRGDAEHRSTRVTWAGVQESHGHESTAMVFTVI